MNRRTFPKSTGVARGVAPAGRSFARGRTREDWMTWSTSSSTRPTVSLPTISVSGASTAGRERHSFAKEPTVKCPTGNGRVYFRLGDAPKNFDEPQSPTGISSRTPTPRALGMETPRRSTRSHVLLTIELGNKKVGITESRSKLFAAFGKEAPKEFQACVFGDF